MCVFRSGSLRRLCECLEGGERGETFRARERAGERGRETLERREEGRVKKCDEEGKGNRGSKRRNLFVFGHVTKNMQILITVDGFGSPSLGTCWRKCED
jgi:hypothetical protein